MTFLSRGRLRLGIGVGWNPVEYEALGEEFTNRGKRSEEQVQLMRMLWTQRSVTFHGSYHRVTGAGLAPLPIQQPIPVWFGGQSPPAYRRAGRLGDGWFPQMQPGPELEEARRIVSGAATEAGRDPASLGMDGRELHQMRRIRTSVDRFRSLYPPAVGGSIPSAPTIVLCGIARAASAGLGR